MRAILVLILAWPLAATETLKTLWEKEQYAFTPAVREAYLDDLRSAARTEIGDRLPQDFWNWIAANPLLEAAIYAAHDRAADLLLQLYGLRLDLGQERFETYHQLSLAGAVVATKQAVEPDLSPRQPLVLHIGGDPRVPVETNTPERPLDKHDHIINFLNLHQIEEEVVVSQQESELKYDERGIAIPQTGKKQEPVMEKRRRSLYASDVLASKDLQAKFNAYMAEMGHPTDIDCGDKLVHWDGKDAVHGDARKAVTAAYRLFRDAYEAKGLLPKERDPIPSMGERLRYIIRNYEHQFPADAKREWPQFPITAPWPVMTLLVDDDQPLREREERWLAFRDHGEFKKYGEYIGAVAQQFDIQSARRLKPHPFTYHTVQMMLKDGGVCGTMASISVRSHIALGIPACQAIQPGHCALVSMTYDTKKDQYACIGGQYATGGHEITTPFARWYLGEPAKPYKRNPGFEVQPNPRKPMVYHQSVAWAVNYGFESFVDALLAHHMYESLDAASREAGGMPLLLSGLAHNPYAFLVTDAAQQAADGAIAQLGFWESFSAELEKLGDRYGCKPDGLYAQTVRSKVFASLSKLPLPDDPAAQKRVYDFLQTEGCDEPKALIRYRLACEGLPAVLAQTEADFQAHLMNTRAKPGAANDEACRQMEAALKATAECIDDKDARLTWAGKLWQQAVGRETYVGRWNNINTDRSVNTLARLARQKMPKREVLTRSLLDRLSNELRQSVEGERQLEHCRHLATTIEAAANFAKDDSLRQEWLGELAKIIAGHERFAVGKKSKRDPCADIIAKLAN
jgi:hypothetical protein